MLSRLTILICVLAVVFSGISYGADKQKAKLIPLGMANRTDLSGKVSLSASTDTCYVSQNQEIIYKIDSWVTGYELYKSLLNPGLSCTNAYPFTVTGINMPMYFADTTPVVVSVDIESVDSTTIPGCKAPGVLLAISSEYELYVPNGGGFYNIWIPLDTPFVVNGPFFGGFYLGNAIDEAAGAAVVIDTFPVTCATYNIWDTAVGFIDLCDNGYYNFPGRLAMEASGIPGGTATSPIPVVSWLSPAPSELLLGTKELWAWEHSGSTIIDYVSFSYSYNGGSYVEIGRDYDGTTPLRDGVHTTVTGSGFSFPWDFSSLTEGTYTLKATAVDTLGRSALVTVSVTIEPTPPIASITSPANGADFCTPLKAYMSSTDDNIAFVEVYRKQARWNYSAGMATLNQTAVGDFCSGPVAAAMAIKLWYDRGYTAPMTFGGVFKPIDSIGKRLAGEFKTATNKGTTDELFYSGLRTYLVAVGNEFNLDSRRHPDYFTLRAWAEEEQRAVMIGLGGAAAPWMVVDGFKQWSQTDGTHLVTVSNPVTGLKEDLSMREGTLGGELLYLGTWHPIDIMISMTAKTWSVTRSLCAIDMDGSDGWSISWTPGGVAEDSLYFIRSYSKDVSAYRAASTVLLQYDCSQTYTHGDYNNDAITDITDLVILINYIAKKGAAPVGGGTRADANCDGYVNMSDVVYFINYAFNGTAGPCR